MVVAVYGGSFNPPHVVHAMVASWVRWTGQAERVWLVPVFRHAFEKVHAKELAPYEHRVAWCRALAEDVGGLDVSTIEEELSTPSFTVDTLRTLRARHPDHRFRLVVGSDVLPTLPQWKEWDVIAREFDPIVVGRAGTPVPEGAIVFPDVSSTEIRRRLREGQGVSHLVTPRVETLLREVSWTGGSSSSTSTVR